MYVFRNNKQPTIVSLKVGDMVLLYNEDKLIGSYLVVRKLDGFMLQNTTGESIYCNAETLKELLEILFRGVARDCMRIEHYPQSRYMLNIIEREDY